MHEEFLNYNFHYVPSKFAEECLAVSDGMGYVSSKSFHYHRQTFRNNQLLCVLKGTLYVEQYGTRLTLHAGEGVLMRLTDEHRYDTDALDVAAIAWIHFRGDMFTPLVNRLFEGGCLPLVFSCAETADKIFSLFPLVQERYAGFEYDLSPRIFSLVTDVTKESMMRLKTERKERHTWFAERIQRYVDFHICEKIDLDKMSSCLHISKYHFCRMFSEVFGISPIQYVLHRKIDLSKELLTQTSDEIEEIAQSLSFSDQSHFSRTFRRFEGITPLKYRKLSQNK